MSARAWPNRTRLSATAYTLVEVIISTTIGFLALALVLELAHQVNKGDGRLDARTQPAMELALLQEQLEWDLVRAIPNFDSVLPGGNPGDQLVLRVVTSVGQIPPKVETVRYTRDRTSGRLARNGRELPVDSLTRWLITFEAGLHPQISIRLDGFHGTSTSFLLALPKSWQGPSFWNTTPGIESAL